MNVTDGLFVSKEYDGAFVPSENVDFRRLTICRTRQTSIAAFASLFSLRLLELAELPLYKSCKVFNRL